MYLRGISIQNYRNLEPVSMALGQGFWAVLGENGQGKSNLLEAVSVLCMGRSRKAGRDRDLVRFGESYMRLEGRFSREHRGDLESAVRVSEEGKELLLFGSAVTRLAKFIGEASCVLFNSNDVEMVLGEPSGRRLFLNEALGQVNQAYLFDLGRSRRALEQKNRALKDVRKGFAPASSIGIWDSQLSQHGGRVCARRDAFLRRLGDEAARLYTRLSGGAEELETRYVPSAGVPDDPERWAEQIAERIAERKQDEILRGISLVGPQRDDFTMTLDGADVRSFASRGQARTAALALRLAQCRIAFEDTGEWPIVLLDDVFAELDVSRRQLVAELAGEAQQVFASSASESDLPPEMQPAPGVIRVCRGSVAIEENACAVQA